MWNLKLIKLLSLNLILLIAKLQADTLAFQYWYDMRLKWNATQYGGIQSVRINTESIWLPAIEPYNR